MSNTFPSVVLILTLASWWLAGPPAQLIAQPRLDSLEQAYQTAASDEQRFELLQAMTSRAYHINFERALAYAKRGARLATEVNSEQWRPEFEELQGQMHANLGHLDSAEWFFQRALDGYLANQHLPGQASAYFKFAWLYNVRGEHQQGLEVSLKGLRIMESLEDQSGIAGALSRVANALYAQGEYEESLDYARQGIDICHTHEIESELPYLLSDAGYACLGLEQYEQALTYFDEALKQVRSLNWGPASIADMANARGNANKKLQRYPEAVADYELSLAKAEELNYFGAIAAATANLGEIYLLTNEYETALGYQLQTIAAQEALGNRANLTENYGHLSRIYEELGDYEAALEYERKARRMRDSTASVESDAAMLELRTAYETEKKEALIDLQAEQIRQQRLVQGLFVGLLVLLALLAATFYRNARARRRTNELLAAQNEQIEAKSQQNELLLKEIHHRVKNNLQTISSLLYLQSAQIQDADVKQAVAAGQHRVESMALIHQKLYQRDNLAGIEMKDYLSNLSESLLNTFDYDPARIDLQIDMDPLELDVDTAVPLGLIVNELITNSLKYAFPEGRNGCIRIRLQRTDAGLELYVADDGVGAANELSGTSFGSQLIQLLTQQLGGKIEQGSDPGYWTRVLV